MSHTVVLILLHAWHIMLHAEHWWFLADQWWLHAEKCWLHAESDDCIPNTADVKPGVCYDWVTVTVVTDSIVFTSHSIKQHTAPLSITWYSSLSRIQEYCDTSNIKENGVAYKKTCIKHISLAKLAHQLNPHIRCDQDLDSILACD